jgi:hypothetical protein
MRKSTKAIMSGMRQLEIRTRRLVNDSLAGEYHSVFKGRGMDFDEVREYSPATKCGPSTGTSPRAPAAPSSKNSPRSAS